MLNSEALEVYRETYFYQRNDKIEIVYLSRRYEHNKNLSYNIEQYNVKNLTKNSGCTIEIATHWNPPKIVDTCHYGYARDIKVRK